MITITPGACKCIEVRKSGRISVSDRAKATIAIIPEGDAEIFIDIGKACDVLASIIIEKKARLALTIDVGAGSKSCSSALVLSSADIRAKIMLSGKGARASDSLAFVQKEGMELSVDSCLAHRARDTEGDVLVKGVAFGRSEARLGGLIKIEKKASGSKSHLGEHVLIVGEDAHASANPRLEIENNDVASRHSATVSKIGSEKLFYLMSRGLAQADAEKLAVSGFLESMAMRIPEGQARSEFLSRIEKAV